MMRFVFLLSVGLLPGLLGCGGRDSFLAVEGVVRLDAKPIEEGSIALTPLGAGRSAGAEIRGGRFAIEPRDGLAAGRYRVEITAFEATGRKLVDEDLAGREEAEFRQIIPQRYNAMSTLEVMLEPQGDNRLEFELTGGSE